MENKTYQFDSEPLNHQPSGHCDFSKICNTEKIIITNLNTREILCYDIKKRIYK